ncbi:uncharacterized protein G2W53_007919 [Senna tora]|uniref:Uncharacterized protein n=1 Tax=Senna tora TaxID=362788 RepID=A0A834X7C5_9FABA|nr:uncharacterized protein G2W53_007919 [Senna tora]
MESQIALKKRGFSQVSHEERDQERARPPYNYPDGA